MDSFEEWLSKDMQGDSDRPEATFVALVDGEVAGYAKLSLSKSDTKVAYHDMTGVRRAFRGRGIAAALKRTADRVGEAGRATRSCRPRTRCGTSRSAALNERHGYTLRARPGHPARGAVRAGLSAPASASALSSRSICRLASRSAIERRLSPLSLPRPSATSTFTLPSLK